MAAEPKGTGAGARKIKLDDVTAKVVADPKNAGDAVLATGFLGDSSDSNHIRIYWDASMASYIDVAAEDIIHTEPLPKEQSPLGGSYIWLKRSAFGLSAGQGGNPMTGRFFEGPLMAAYGQQFGGAAAATPAAAAQLPSLTCTYAPGCWYSWGFCPTFFHCGPFHTPGCPQVAAQDPIAAAAAAGPGMIPSLVCSYAPGCWYSVGACPTMFHCNPWITPACPRFDAQAAAAPGAAAGVVNPESYAPHCWFSWNACPTLFGGCGPHRTPGCPQFQAQQAPAAAAAVNPESYAPHCWFSWNACPTLYGCGPHISAYCPQFQAAYGFGQPWTAHCSFASCGHPCTR
jgi:hypothetical protein